MPMHGILLSCLGRCPALLLEIVRETTKMDKQDCWSFTCYLFLTLGSSSKCSQLKSFPYVLPWQMFIWTGSTGSTSFSWGRSTHYSDRLHHFSVKIPRYYKNTYVNSFFPHTVRFCNSLPIECFPLSHDLNGFNSRINRHLLTVGSFF